MASGSADVRRADDGDISATLQPNQNIGLAFPATMGSGANKYSPEGGVFVVTVTLTVSSSSYSIAAPSSGTLGGDGNDHWLHVGNVGQPRRERQLSGLAGPGINRRFDRFRLVRRGLFRHARSRSKRRGKRGPGASNLGRRRCRHQHLRRCAGRASFRGPSGHRLPTPDNAEHAAASSGSGGLYLPPALCLTGTNGVTALGNNLDTSSAYKILDLRLTTNWQPMLGQATPGTVGSLLSPCRSPWALSLRSRECRRHGRNTCFRRHPWERPNPRAAARVPRRNVRHGDGQEFHECRHDHG